MNQLSQKKVSDNEIANLQSTMVRELKMAFMLMEQDAIDLLNEATENGWTVEKLISKISNL